MSETGGHDEPTQVNPEATAAMPNHVAPDAVPPGDEPEKKGMSAEAKWLIVGFVILAAIGIAGIVVSATSDDDDTPATTTVPVTTQPERPSTSERRETIEPPTTEDRPETTAEAPTTEPPDTEPPTTEASP